MNVLDDPRELAARDPAGMLAVVEDAPDAWRDGVERAGAADLSTLPPADALDHVVVCGMGGSGIAGDVLRAAVAPRLPVPVAVVKGYALPAFVGPRSLVFCVSHSGDTEETVACFSQALQRRAPTVAVATGGELAEEAQARGVAWVSPAAGLQPRAALPSLAAAPLVVLERIGLLGDLSADFAALDTALRSGVRAWGRAVPAGSNPAKRLATRLEGLVPVVWGQEGVLEVAAARWKTQLNENAKVPAFASVLPELDHNEVAGYDPGVGALDRVALVVLRSPEEDPRVAPRIPATLALVRGRVAAVEEAHAPGTGPLARLASAVLLGDLTSVYLAILRGVDPTPVAVIERLKAAIR